MSETIAVERLPNAVGFNRVSTGDGARRIADLIIACALILFTLPLMVIVALAIKCDSRGPIFYRQERVGLRGARFMVMKFRSMMEHAEVGGRPVWSAKNDARTT